jgi:hypothetical protein
MTIDVPRLTNDYVFNSPAFAARFARAWPDNNGVMSRTGPRAERMSSFFYMSQHVQ